MIVRVDPSSPVPVYEQIRVQIEVMIATGTLAEGARLPTIRQLAGDLGVAKGTVAKAYEALVAEGAVTASGRQGTVVAARREPDPVSSNARLRERALQLALAAHQAGASRAEVRRRLDEALAQVRLSGA